MIANADEMESENDVIKLQRYYVYVLRREIINFKFNMTNIYYRVYLCFLFNF